MDVHDMCRQVTNIFPYRIYRGDGLSDRSGYTIRVNINAMGDDVEHVPIPYETNMPDHSVRVPALMLFAHRCCARQCVSKEQAKTYAIEAFAERLRRQTGAHLFVERTGTGLLYLDTWWDGEARQIEERTPEHQYKRRYVVFAPIDKANAWPMCCVFPCFKLPPSTPSEPDLLLGVGFCEKAKATYDRTYSRFKLISTSNMTFDITQHFFREGPLEFKGQTRNEWHFSNTQWFPRRNDNNDRGWTAVYLCRAARAIVMDDRLPENHNQNPKKHLRSLYQQGSLLLFQGTISFHFGVAPKQLISWQDLFKKDNAYFTPLDRIERELDDEEKNKKLDNNYRPVPRNLKNKVIFLGYTESQYNTVCWEILIEDNPQNANLCSVEVRIPENGIIEDIAPWQTGFELIQARHHYQQIWRAVVKYSSSTIPPSFKVPNSEYIMRRILGIPNPDHNEWWCPMAVTFPYDRLDVPRPQDPEWDDDIHAYIVPYADKIGLSLRNIEHLTNWHESPFKDRVPPAPPLYPPIKLDGHKYMYIGPHHKFFRIGTINNDNVYAIQGYPYLYYMKYSENVPGHVWTEWPLEEHFAVTDNIVQDNIEVTGPSREEWFRWSADYVKYVKQPYESRYQMKTLFLQKIPTHDSHSTDNRRGSRSR